MWSGAAKVRVALLAATRPADEAAMKSAMWVRSVPSVMTLPAAL